jgi:hypothetical protein
VLDAMREYIAEVERFENHVYRAQLADIPIGLGSDPVGTEAAA